MRIVPISLLVSATLVVSACSAVTSTEEVASPDSETVVQQDETDAAAADGGDLGDSSPSPSPAEPGYADIVTGPLTSAEICGGFEGLIADLEAVVVKREKSLSDKADDPYAAAKFVDRNAWIYEDLSVKFNGDWEALAVTSLNAVSDGQAGTVDDVDDYLAAALDACGLSEAYSGLQRDVQGIDAEQASVLSAAEDKPWYPKGYYEWDSNVAWRYANDQGGDPCGYSRCTYGRVQVITLDGCPGGLYAEMNFKNSADVVDDWSNDSVPFLGPGDKALLTFRSYTSLGDGTIQLVELNCR